MPFTVPNKLAASFTDQAKLDSVDLDILAAGALRSGVISGCAVTAQASPNMTVAVAAGLASVAGQIVTVTAGNVTITAADSTNPRFDLIAVDNAGTKSRVGGTAAANPVFPTIPANSVILAAVYVPAGDTAINSNQITDKRVVVSANGMYLATKTSDTTVNNTTTETVIWSITIPGGLLAAGDRVWLSLHGNYLNNSGVTVAVYHTAALGATILQSLTQGGLTTSANRRKWGGYMELIAESTTSQSIAMNVPHTAATSNSFGPHNFVVSGSGDTAENTASDIVLEWRFKFDTANTLAEVVAKTGVALVYKATG